MRKYTVYDLLYQLLFLDWWLDLNDMAQNGQKFWQMLNWVLL